MSRQNKAARLPPIFAGLIVSDSGGNVECSKLAALGMPTRTQLGASSFGGCGVTYVSGAYIVLPRLRATSRKITTRRISSKLKRPITKTRSLIRTQRPANRDVSARAMRISSPIASCLCQESTGQVRKNYVEHLFATDRGVLRAKRHLLPAAPLASRVMRLRFSTISTCRRLSVCG